MYLQISLLLFIFSGLCFANPTISEIYPDFRLIHNHPSGLMDFDIFSVINPEFRYMDCFIDGKRLKRYRAVDQNHYNIAQQAMEDEEWEEIYLYTWHVPSRLSSGRHLFEMRCSETKDRQQVIKIVADMQSEVMDLPLLSKRQCPSISYIDMESSRIVHDMVITENDSTTSATSHVDNQRDAATQ